MPLQAVNMLPGISKKDSPYAEGKVSSYVGGRVAQGRYTDGQNIRFVAGSPEKLAGWVSQRAAGPLTGVPRALITYRNDNLINAFVIGTETHLYTFDGVTLTDITPLRTIATGSLTNPITTSNGSATVAIADSSQALQNGDHVFLSAAAAVGGILLNGWYPVGSRTGSGYSITAPIPATSTVSTGAGGTVAFSYPRVTLTNPFTTTAGSHVVTVAHATNGALLGAYVDFSGASAVGGLTISGEYQIATIVDSGHYTIMAASAATSGATGGGSVSVIYPIPLQASSTTSSSAYGSGAYGIGAYGVGSFSAAGNTAGWTLANYGNLLAAAPIGGTIYFYSAAAGGRAYPLLNAPAAVLAMFITRERFIVALGINASYLELAWCDQVDPTQWAASLTNTANSGRTLAGGNFFVGGLPVRDQIELIFTDRVAFQMTYTGDNNVYATPDVGDNTGLIGPHAACAMGETAYWMAPDDFWSWSGTPQQLNTDDIREFVFGNLNPLYAWKSLAGTNRAKREVWFHFVSKASTEVDSCVIYHVDQQCWSVGAPPRTAWVDSQIFSTPFACSAAGALYQHETGTDADGAAMLSSLEASPFDVSSGSSNVDVFGFVPDFERVTGAMTVSMFAQYYSEDVMTIDGPYTINAPTIAPVTGDDPFGGGTPTTGQQVTSSGTERIDLRTDGKLIGFQMISNVVGGDFRLGIVRLDAQPAGARR